jgi:hypothetical protein
MFMPPLRTAPVIQFEIFVVVWNHVHDLPTPRIHVKLAQWLEERWCAGDTRLLLMAFRAAGKSTLVGLFAAWLLACWPDLRILVLAADQSLAGKMVGNVRRILEKHPFVQGLKPERPDQWAGERFTINRTLSLRDPSMMAKGITANITGCRADVIIFDDVEVPNTCNTAEKRRELRARLREAGFVLAHGGTQLYVGTPHTYHTIYADAPRGDVDAAIENEDLFLQDFMRLELPIVDEDGDPQWFERYTSSDIEALRLQTGPNAFASQMMLRPVSAAEGRLDSALLKVYRAGLEYDKILRRLYIGDTPMDSVSAWWDPAFGSAAGDRSVIAVVFMDQDGQLYIHRVVYLANSLPHHPTLDEATAQARQVADLAKDLMLPSVCVETNGIGQFLPGILRNELGRLNVPTRVVEKTSRQNKDMRILEAFDAPLAARRLYVHADVLRTPFRTEMQDWRPESTGGHDDGLDAVAGALREHPVRISRIYSGAPAHVWHRAGQAQTADTAFDV